MATLIVNTDTGHLVFEHVTHLGSATIKGNINMDELIRSGTIEVRQADGSITHLDCYKLNSFEIQQS